MFENKFPKQLFIFILVIYINSTFVFSFEWLDQTFGQDSDGMSVLDSKIFQVTDAIVDLNGKILIASTSMINKNQILKLIRCNSNGRLDKSFGKNGIVEDCGSIISVKNDLDGNIFAAGVLDNNFLIVKYDSNGNLIKKFNKLIGEFSLANCLMIDKSGNIIIGGNTNFYGHCKAFIARFNEDLEIDFSFGNQGIVIYESGYHAEINSILIDSNNCIIAGGCTSINESMVFFIIKCLSNGSLDPKFGKNGMVIGNRIASDSIYSLSFDKNNNILAGGYSIHNIKGSLLLACYDSSGNLLDSFGKNGIVQAKIGDSSFVHSILFDSKNKIIITGSSDDKFIIVRYNDDGTIDNSFGSNGILTIKIGSSDYGKAVVQQLDGKYIVAGYSDEKIAIVRIKNDISSIATINNEINGKIFNKKIIPIDGTSSKSNVLVDVYIDGIFFKSIITDRLGQWKIFSGTLSEGKHIVSAQLQNDINSKSQVNFIIDTTIACNFAIGKTLRVDKIFGDDLTGVRHGGPFFTINAALEKAQFGDIVYVAPGIYEEKIILPDGVTLMGLSVNNCILKQSDVNQNTDLVTMGQYSRIENLFMSITSQEHHQLRGIMFPGNSSVTSSILNSTIYIDNSKASTDGKSNIYGLHSIGAEKFNNEYHQTFLNSIVEIVSCGEGDKRALLLDNATEFRISNSKMFVKNLSGNGSAICAESRNKNAKIFAFQTLFKSFNYGNGICENVSEKLGKIKLSNCTLNNEYN